MRGTPYQTIRRPFQRMRYRAGQFWRGVQAHVSAEEIDQAAQILPPDAFALFERMPIDAQRHSLNVLNAVHAAGFRNADLDAAALLHDVGKLAADEGGVRLGLWLRSPLVLLDAWSPRTLARVARADPASGWRYTAYVHREHAQIGAEWAAVAGCSKRTCWLIRHHQDALDAVKPDGMELDDKNLGNGKRAQVQPDEAELAELRLLAALQAADDIS